MPNDTSERTVITVVDAIHDAAGAQEAITREQARQAYGITSDPALPAAIPGAPLQAPAATPTIPVPSSASPAADLDADFASLEAEVLRDGAPSAATLAKFAGRVPEHRLLGAIEGLKAQAELRVLKAHRVAGGQADFEAAVAWASANLSKPEIEAFNAAVSSPHQAAADLAVRGLVAQHRASGGGHSAQRAVGSAAAGQTSGVLPFRDQQEQLSAQKDPRYQYDAEYRNNVLVRIAASTHYM